MGLGGPSKNIAPPPKLNDAHFPAWAIVFCFFNIIFDQLKELAAGGKKIASKNVGSNFSRN